MKVLTALISIMLLSLLLSPILAFAAVQPIQLFLNGKQLAADVAPRIIENNTVVPVRVIAEALGSKVQWEEKSRKVTVDKEDTRIQLYIDKRDALVNGKSFPLETPPSIVEGSTMLPLRFISEQLGVQVTWDELTQSVFLSAQGEPVKLAAAARGPKVSDKEAIANTSSESGKLAKNTESKNEAGKNTASAVETRQDAVSGDVPATSDKDKPAVSKADKPSLAAVGATRVSSGTGKPAELSKPPEVVKDLEASGKVGEAPVSIVSISFEGDQLTVKTSGGQTLPPANVSGDPKHITIDFPNGKLDPALKLNADGEGNVSEQSPSISRIHYLLFSKQSTNVRIIIDTVQKMDIHPSAVSTAALTSWTLTPAKEEYKVVIDPGHGGKDTGALSVTKRREKDFVLALGKKVSVLLEKEPKIEVTMTRDDDTFVELPDRVAIANEMKADVFVSIHGNAAESESVHGVETHYYTPQSLAFAKLMHQQLLTSTSFADRKVKQSDFHVIKNTTMPSLLLEIGFLTNKNEENLMFQEAFQNKVAASIVAGIKQQLKLE